MPVMDVAKFERFFRVAAGLDVDHCGHVGCCDSSPNRHATKPFQRTSHPLVRSAEPGERWIWYYVDQIVPGELEV